MDKDRLIEMLSRLPAGTRVFVRGGSWADDAWTPELRVFEYNGKVTAYVCSAPVSPTLEHRNFPENYSGVTEITAKVFGNG